MSNIKVFSYKVKESSGQISERKVRAQSLLKAKSYLKQKNIKFISIEEEKEGFFDRLFFPTSVPQDDIVAFTQLLSGCIRSGLNVKESLILLSKQVDNKLLRKKIIEVISDLEDGSTISDAFNKQTDVFPLFFPMLVKAGEASGDLATVMEYIGNYLEKANNLKKEIKSVATYPTIVTTVGLVLLTVILIFVAPTFKQVFSQSGRQLPVPTIILFFLSDMLIKNSKIILSGLIILIGTFLLYVRSEKGKKNFHRFLLTAPIFGKIVKEMVLLRFLKGFDIMINNNVPLLQTLAVLDDGTTNLCLKEIITEMRKDIAKGLPLAGVLTANKDIMTPLVAYTISMGEKAGNLGISLTRIGDFVDKEINYSMKKLSSRLDPIMTLGLGIMVLFIALAIYLPIFDMMKFKG